MKTLEEIRNTPALLLTGEEIAMLPPDSQEWVRECQARHQQETNCPGHEPVSTSSQEESRRGWHRMHCRHCGKDMSVDSSG